MYKKIILVGAGQLGSRYLQGMAACCSSLDISVFDISASSLNLSRERWKEAGGDQSRHRITWNNSFPSNIGPVDLAIIATSSQARAQLIQKLAASVSVKYWVIEKVLAQSPNEVQLIQSSLASSRGAWVNTSRRMMSWHQSLKSSFDAQGPFAVSYSSNFWGLACNAIHYIDLVSWWSDELLENVSTVGLAQDWLPSKRVGYYEITGELKACFSGGSVIRLRSVGTGAAGRIKIKARNNVLWDVDETIGEARSTAGQWVYGKIEYQSQLTTRLVDGILDCGHCDLPTLDVSAHYHNIYLEAMLSHWNASQHRDDVSIPIT